MASRERRSVEALNLSRGVGTGDKEGGAAAGAYSAIHVSHDEDGEEGRGRADVASSALDGPEREESNHVGPYSDADDDDVLLMLDLDV